MVGHRVYVFWGSGSWLCIEVLGFGVRVQGLGFTVQGCGCAFWGSGL